MRDNTGHQASIDAPAGGISESLMPPHSVVSQVKVALFGINTPVGIAGSFFGITLGRIKGLGAKGVVGLTPQFLAVALDVAYFHSRTTRADNGRFVTTGEPLLTPAFCSWNMAK
ncbi:hypothetical protein [Arthrobacter sp. Bi83]|uniref:hypothetical protein n=1 Tax=Arthrobacter sp. Bi83 TaxID=2822353 RepID=UPI001E521679|nr:hypothetical protein [Arthrobacter sp. Bi83]